MLSKASATPAPPLMAFLAGKTPAACAGEEWAIIGAVARGPAPSRAGCDFGVKGTNGWRRERGGFEKQAVTSSEARPMGWEVCLCNSFPPMLKASKPSASLWGVITAPKLSHWAPRVQLPAKKAVGALFVEGTIKS